MELKSGITDTLQYAGSLATDALAKRSGAQTGVKGDLAAKKVAREFEALFVGMMVKSMRETVGKDPITDGGHGEEVYRSMLDQEYARVMTERGGVGLAAMLEKQMIPPTQGSGESRAGVSQNQKNALSMYGVKNENKQ